MSDAPGPTTGPRPPSLLYVLKQLELTVRARLDDILRPRGVTVLQYTALTVLERHDGLSAAQLARDSFVTAQSMADMVRTLESRRLICREQLPQNRRELRIYLTDEARALLAQCAEQVDGLERQMISALPAGQDQQFRASLNNCRRMLLQTAPNL